MKSRPCQFSYYKIKYSSMTHSLPTNIITYYYLSIQTCQHIKKIRYLFQLYFILSFIISDILLSYWTKLKVPIYNRSKVTPYDGHLTAWRRRRAADGNEAADPIWPSTLKGRIIHALNFSALFLVRMEL